MEPLFEGLTASEIEYLKYLQERGYFDGIEMFTNLDTSSDYRFKKLEQGGYIIVEDNGPYSGARFVKVTGKGMAALVDHDKYQNQIQPLTDQIRALNAISDSLKQQVSLSEQASKSSEKEAKLSKKIAILSIIISVVALLPDFVKLIFAFAGKPL